MMPKDKDAQWSCRASLPMVQYMLDHAEHAGIYQPHVPRMITISHDLYRYSLPLLA